MRCYGRSGQQVEWTTGGVDNRRSGQQEEWTTGGVDNRLRIGTMDWNEPGEENKNNMIIIVYKTCRV